MTEQLDLLGAQTCLCGCGRKVPQADGRGRPTLFATPACRVRFHRRNGPSGERTEAVTKIPATQDTAPPPSAAPAVHGRAEAAVRGDVADSQKLALTDVAVEVVDYQPAKAQAEMLAEAHRLVRAWTLTLNLIDKARPDTVLALHRACAAVGWVPMVGQKPGQTLDVVVRMPQKRALALEHLEAARASLRVIRAFGPGAHLADEEEG